MGKLKWMIPFIFTGGLFTIPLFGYSQPCPPGCLTAAIPIDGGVSFLVAAGVVYGVKKMYSRKKGNK